MRTLTRRSSPSRPWKTKQSFISCLWNLSSRWFQSKSGKTKTEPTQLFPADLVASKIAAKKGQVFSDYLEAYVQTIVPEACLERSGSAELSFSLHPSGVYTSKKVKKGDLQLYPLGIAQLVKAEYVGKIKGIRLKYEGIRFQLSTYKQLSSF